MSAIARLAAVKLGLVDGYSPEEVAPELDFPVLVTAGLLWLSSRAFPLPLATQRHSHIQTRFIRTARANLMPGSQQH